MKKLIYIVALLLAIVPAGACGKIKIVTTLPDYADLARQIGGELVEVHSVMKGPENVHNILAKPTEMLKLNQADLFVHSGLDTEPWRDNLVKGARNPKVLAGGEGEVDMSVGIDLLDTPAGKVDRSQGDMHAYGNPHYTLSFVNVQKMIPTLTDAMARIDPANEQQYRGNAGRLLDELSALQKELTEKIRSLGGLRIVTFHKAWDYFARDCGIQIVGNVEAKIGITPSAAEMRSTIQLMKAHNVKIVVVETYNSLSEAQFVAQYAGAKAIVLPDHVNGLEGVDSYQKLLRYDVEKIIEASR